VDGSKSITVSYSEPTLLLCTDTTANDELTERREI